ncbi:MAG: hypothetical protein Q8Q97_01410, partial [bacterium]|nr:hypothetical protein [bacterium]
MAKRRNKNRDFEKSRWHDGLKPETKQSVFAIASFALALLFTLAAFGKAGLVGAGLQRGFELLFGKAFFLVPLVFFLAGFSFLFSLRKHFVLATLIGGILFLLSALGIADLVLGERSGGWLGFLASFTFLRLFEFWASLVLLSASALVGILIMLNAPLRFGTKQASHPRINLPVAAVPPPAKAEEKTAVEKAAPAFQSEPQPQGVGEEFISSALAKVKRRAKYLLPPLDL